MLLPKFDYYDPKSLDECCQILTEFRETALLIAGGTDVMVKMKKGEWEPDQLVSIGGIAELKQIEKTKGAIHIGAGVTVSDVIEAEELKQTLSALVAGAENLGTPLIRNLATIGGNVGSARPAADIPPNLMAYDAQLILKSASGERLVPINEFFTGPGETVKKPDEILVKISVDLPPPLTGAGYAHLGVRKAADCNIVNVSACMSLDDSAESIKTVRVVIGCVGPTPRRSPSAESVLSGQKLSDDIFEQAGKAAMNDADPIDDSRGTADYKRAMVAVLTKRALNIACNEAKGGPA